MKIPWLALLAFTISLRSLLAADPAIIPIWPEGVPNLRANAGEEKLVKTEATNIHHPSLTVYPAPAGKACGTAVIICPGGGYRFLAMESEGAQIAAWANANGITAFVLKYRLVEYGQPAPLQDVLRAMRIVRSRAAEFGVQPNRIGVMGFSAGGHVASCAATMFDAPEGKTGAPLDATSARPDFAVLAYAVITMEPPFAHSGSRFALLGRDPAPELIKHWSTETQVTKDTSPTFIFHSSDDNWVPVQNALAFYSALKQAGVLAEMHVYEHGPHGMGMKAVRGPATDWPKALEGWLRLHGWLTPLAK